MTWVMVLLWGSVFFGASTAVGFGNKDLCDAALATAVADLQARHLTVFSASCGIQYPAPLPEGAK